MLSNLSSNDFLKLLIINFREYSNEQVEKILEYKKLVNEYQRTRRDSFSSWHLLSKLEELENQYDIEESSCYIDFQEIIEIMGKRNYKFRCFRGYSEKFEVSFFKGDSNLPEIIWEHEYLEAAVKIAALESLKQYGELKEI